MSEPKALARIKELEAALRDAIGTVRFDKWNARQEGKP